MRKTRRNNKKMLNKRKKRSHNRKKQKNTRRNLHGRGSMFSTETKNRFQIDESEKEFIDACIYGDIGKINNLKSKIKNVSIGLFPALACYNFHIIDYLIDQGANINYLIGDEGEYEYLLSVRQKLSLKIIRRNRTILMMCVNYPPNNHIVEAFNFVLGLNPNVNFRSKGTIVYENNKEFVTDDFTALMYAIISKNFYYILPLVRNGADIYEKVKYYDMTNDGEIYLTDKNSIEILTGIVKHDETNEKMKQIIKRIKDARQKFLWKGFDTVTEEVITSKNDNILGKNSDAKKRFFDNADIEKYIKQFG